MKRFFRQLRAHLFGARNISVGHCNTKSGSSVLLILGRKRAGLTPAGARMVANQLTLWADHAETQKEIIATMKWIVSVTRDDADKAVTSWVSQGIAGAADAASSPAQ